MNKFLQTIKAYSLIDEFKNCEVKLYVKNYGSTLVISIKGNLPSKQSIFSLIDAIQIALEKTNFQKFELFIKNHNDRLEIAKKLIEVNYSYICKIENNKLIVDCRQKNNSGFDLIYIKELLKNLDIDIYSNIDFVNYIFPSCGINQEYLSREKQSNYQNDSKYIYNFSNVKPVELELTMLPKTKEELQNMSCPKVVVEGQIFSIESKNTKKAILYFIRITNFRESVTIKFFSNTTISLKENDVIKAVGVLTYDDFNQEIALNVTNSTEITIIEAEYIQEISLDGLFDAEELSRTELHVHSKFSTQDGLASVKDYFQNASAFGIKALAVTDHENVQAFPDIEKYSKEFNIKPIYGVELNIVDKDSYKIFYTGESTKNHLVGIDIETTGFSAVYDEIIEISAYKYINNQKYEYSTLVKLKDEKMLTNKISDLTGITLRMLKDDGKCIDEALKELVAFIDDGIIVAHNATFDVHFLEYKFKYYLGIEKHYSFIDTLNFSRSVLNDGKMKKFALNNVCKKLKVELTEHHRAIYDAKACLDICYKLFEMIGQIKVTDVSQIDENTHIILKVTSKKNKEKLLKFISEYELTYEEENKNLTDINRVNSIFKIKIDSEKYKNLLVFLNSLPAIKIVDTYRILDTYSKDYKNLNDLIKEEEIIQNVRPSHITLLLKNQEGLKQLYRLISLSNIHRISSRGNILFLDDILNNAIRKNVLLGSSCANGLFKSVFEKGFENAMRYDYLDYIEIQPLETYLSISDSVYVKDSIKDCILNIIEKAKEVKKIVVASCDAHYIYPKFKEYRDVYINTFAVGGVSHPLFGVKNTGTHVLFSTNHLIKQLKEDYGLNLRYIKKIVLENPETISNLISDDIKIIPDKLYTPNDDFLKDKVLDVVGYKVPSIKEEFIKIVNESVKKYMLLNGINKLPNYINNRLNKEMNSIINHGFYIIYYIAYLLVKQSNKDGYVVGSRGSVGSSFVAYLMGITEVNSLAPHYLCSKCHFQIYKGVPDIFKTHVNDKYRKAVESVNDGFDLPEEKCPFCNSRLKRDGHDIPFETFLGFNGDKTPDIDLNFSGDYQAKAHNFCKEVFGEEHAFRAGTISTVASKTAAAYLRQYYSKIDKKVSNTEIKRRSIYLTDVKRTTGQHPGGIIVLPSNMSIYDFTPIQYPANKAQDWFTTHLDYNAIHENVLKMDILGHDDPTILKFLMDIVKEHPNDYPFDNPKDIPIDNSKIMHFLQLDENNVVNSLGIPEFGTTFVKGMLSDIQPHSFYELVKTSGLSHGTDVWNTNAQELINGNTEFGKIPFKEVIGCRDDIMVQLIYAGLEQKQAFEIMEFVRKGKVAKNPEQWNEYKKIMLKHNVPRWYIWSCERIKYMFPKAHAVAYVLSALRIAWFKANKPLDFYQAFFTVRAKVFDIKTIMTNDAEIIQNKIAFIKSDKNASDVDKESVPYLEVAAEMITRGFTFKEPIINLSHSTKFIKMNDNCLLMPFSVLDGVGEITSQSVYNNRKNQPYLDEEDLKKRGKADKKFIESLMSINALVF